MTFLPTTFSRGDKEFGRALFRARPSRRSCTSRRAPGRSRALSLGALAPMSTSLSASVASTRGGAPTAPNAQNLHRRHRPVATRARPRRPRARDSSERPARARPSRKTTRLRHFHVASSSPPRARWPSRRSPPPTPLAPIRRRRPSADGTREFDFKTYKLVVPGVYDEVPIPLKDPATGAVSPTTLLLKDTRVGHGRKHHLALEAAHPASRRCPTFAPPGGEGSSPPSRSARAARIPPSSARAREQGRGGCCTAEYKKSVLGVPRRVVTRSASSPTAPCDTLTAEEDERAFGVEQMGAALRATAESFEVVPY